MVTKTMSVREARANFSDLLGLVHYTKEPVIVERKGKPFAVVISPEQYETIRQGIEGAWATIEKVQERNADQDPDEVLQDVTAVVEAVRQERHAKRQQAAKGSR